jgi:hypothetical protein
LTFMLDLGVKRSIEISQILSQVLAPPVEGPRRGQSEQEELPDGRGTPDRSHESAADADPWEADARIAEEE